MRQKFNPVSVNKMSVGVMLRTRIRHATTLVWTALAIIAMLSGCGLWRGGERVKQDEPPWCLTRFDGDSLYGAVLDSVNLNVKVDVSEPNEFLFTINYGDGTIDSLTNSDIYHSFRLNFAHLYPTKGKYIATIQASYRGTPLCSDTVTVLIQDYVRPSLANKVRVTVTGVTVHVANVVKRDGLPDSVWLTEVEEFRYETVPLPEHEDVLCIEWEKERERPSHGINRSYQQKCRELGISAPVTLSIDGKKLLSLQISTKRPLHDGTSSVDTSYTFGLSGLMLDESIPPTRERALYSMKIPRQTPDMHLEFGWSITEVINGRKEVRQRVLHKSIYENAVVSVEFYR